jgi:hypothetical protein
VQRSIVVAAISGLVSFSALSNFSGILFADDFADGLNYDTEWSETNANRHVQLIDAMIKDGM